MKGKCASNDWGGGKPQVLLLISSKGSSIDEGGIAPGVGGPQ